MTFQKYPFFEGHFILMGSGSGSGYNDPNHPNISWIQFGSATLLIPATVSSKCLFPPGWVRWIGGRRVDDRGAEESAAIPETESSARLEQRKHTEGTGTYHLPSLSSFLYGTGIIPYRSSWNTGLALDALKQCLEFNLFSVRKSWSIYFILSIITVK
jgi:hypothetical protein